MERYLNWTFDYRRHQGAGCDFYGRVTELLARENRDGGRWREFSVLPNFGFNHQGLEDGKTDTAVGSLWIERQLEQSEWIYKVRREGGTSGEKLELQIVMKDDLYMSLMDYRIIRRSILGREITMPPESGRERETAATSVYAVPELIRKNGGEVPDFSFADRYGRVFTGQKVRGIGSDVVERGGKPVRITGYCMLGRANPPSFWWMDEQGKVLIVSTTLLTYVSRG